MAQVQSVLLTSFFFFLIFVYLAASGLCCGMWALCYDKVFICGMWDLVP